VSVISPVATNLYVVGVGVPPAVRLRACLAVLEAADAMISDTRGRRSRLL
jgi:hypothetical protein